VADPAMGGIGADGQAQINSSRPEAFSSRPEVTASLLQRCPDLFADPAHDIHRHGIAKRLVARAVGGSSAAFFFDGMRVSPLGNPWSDSHSSGRSLLTDRLESTTSPSKPLVWFAPTPSVPATATKGAVSPLPISPDMVRALTTSAMSPRPLQPIRRWRA
jgi:hypothetical protein